MSCPFIQFARKTLCNTQCFNHRVTRVTTFRGLLFYTDHRMKRDHKRRQIVATHAEEKRVLMSIVIADGILPEQFRKEFETKLNDLPRWSERKRVINGCRLTGRRFGPEKTCPKPWYFSRYMQMVPNWKTKQGC